MQKLLLASTVLVSVGLGVALYQSNERRLALKHQIINEDVRRYCLNN